MNNILYNKRKRQNILNGPLHFISSVFRKKSGNLHPPPQAGAKLVVDIGCGQKKLPGSIGIDASAFSVADYVLDLNRDKLPFADNSVDFVYSSHALEHLSWQGFFNVIGEIYRVAKNNSQIFITVPYFHSAANLANPFHNNKIAFNEHTFRFFSSAEDNPHIAKEEYATPSCPQWGLRYSANAELEIELETLKIEYLYFAPYRDMPASQQRLARQQYQNVVEIINYHLRVIKPAPRKISKQSQYTEDFNSLIAEQRRYLQGQVAYLLDNPKFEADEQFQRLLQQTEFIEKDGFFFQGEIIYPITEVHRILHEAIQELRMIIDGLQ